MSAVCVVCHLNHLDFGLFSPWTISIESLPLDKSRVLSCISYTNQLFTLVSPIRKSPYVSESRFIGCTCSCGVTCKSVIHFIDARCLYDRNKIENLLHVRRILSSGTKCGSAINARSPSISVSICHINRCCLWFHGLFPLSSFDLVEPTESHCSQNYSFLAMKIGISREIRSKLIIHCNCKQQKKTINRFRH